MPAADEDRTIEFSALSPASLGKPVNIYKIECIGRDRPHLSSPRSDKAARQANVLGRRVYLGHTFFPGLRSHTLRAQRPLLFSSCNATRWSERTDEGHCSDSATLTVRPPRTMTFVQAKEGPPGTPFPYRYTERGAGGHKRVSVLGLGCLALSSGLWMFYNF